jgi:hypothetical protein
MIMTGEAEVLGEKPMPVGCIKTDNGNKVLVLVKEVIGLKFTAGIFPFLKFKISK